MKTILQHRATGRFVKGQGAWTTKEEKARSFTSSLAALDFCARQGISDVEIVLKFSDSRFDIRLRPFERSSRSSCVPRLGSTRPSVPGSRAALTAAA